MASSSRVMVTAFAGVASADGPNDFVDRHQLAVEVGAERGGDGQRRERAGAERLRDEDDAVDLGRLAMTPAHARLVHEDFDPRTDEFVTSRPRDRVLPLAQLGQALAHQARRPCCRASRRSVPSSGEKAKKPHQSSCASSTKASNSSWSSSVSPG